MRLLLMALGLVLAQPAYSQAIVDNPDMTRLFDADQQVRQSEKIDWQAAGKADAERRTATRALLDAGKLRTGTDFWHAAFVFQHGDDPADYLLAHSLAIAAAAKGRADATWIAAATLDRYLQAINQPQIYGTQFGWADKQPVTQEPYAKGIVSDALRIIMGVPPLEAQAKQREQFEKSRSK